MRRRRPKPATASDYVRQRWGDEVVRNRKTMTRALTLLYASQPDEAQRVLAKGLAEGWWT